MIAAIACTAMICASALVAWRWWLAEQPEVTQAELVMLKKDILEARELAQRAISAVSVRQVRGGGASIG